jgi:hypothetical protein
LKHFENLTFNFTSNPLHLQMISETKGIEELKQVDVISIYEQFLDRKIKHGLLTCRQIPENTYEFTRKLIRIYSILTHCAVAQVIDNKEVIINLDAGEIMDINLSGVATVVSAKSPLIFVHRTFAEFLVARHFKNMCFDPPQEEDLDVVEVHLDLFSLFHEGVSEQTMRFIEGFCGLHNKDKKIPDAVLDIIKKVDEKVFKHICHAGMHNFCSLLIGQVFNAENVTRWMVDSHEASDVRVGLFFYACCSSIELATLLSEWCPMLQVEDLDTLVECLAEHTTSRQCIEKAFSRVVDWESRWPRANFFDVNLDGKFSTDFYEFVLEKCPDINVIGLLLKMYWNKAC